MYRFNDVPCMFQFAPLSFLKEEACAYVSVFDDYIVHWSDEVPGETGWQLVLRMTVHVDVQ